MVKVPGWPLLRFIYTYIFSLGFTEGLPGLIYAINLSFYEHMIMIKTREVLSQRHKTSKDIGQNSIAISKQESPELELI
jgi:hypothetical protein